MNEDHTKVELKPVFEKSPVNKNDWTVGLKVKIPLEKVSAWFKKLFKK
jgi:hypothetical protein